ncbi:MAG TPA: nucleoside transporter [Verrucomicrobia bacterium]|nr:nucleoside transporter [Verrucomicrobiota bacterium]
MDAYNLVSFAGLFVLMLIAWMFSSHRNKLNVRVAVWGVILQLVFGVFVFLVPFGTTIFLFLSDGVVKLMNAALEGARFCFGPLAIPSGETGSLGFILVTQGLPTIVFFAALMEILYFLRIMPLLIKGFSRVFTRLMGVSGAEALCTASNIFVGIESATTVLPYLNNMTRSEMCTVLTAGLATIASSVMGLYVLLLNREFPHIAGHLISASLLSAPAALVMSKLLMPETGQPETLGQVVEPHYERESNLIEAAIRGATAGGKLMLGVIVMLLAFIGLVATLNMGLDGLSSLVARWSGVHIGLRLENLLAYVFYPFALVIGVPPSDAFAVARLLGIRAIMTEIPAYLQLNQLIASGAFHHARSAVLASYALCGFAHIPSIAIFIGGISALAPRQTQTLAAVALRALAAATLACLMTAAIAGTFYGKGSLLFNLP